VGTSPRKTAGQQGIDQLASHGNGKVTRLSKSHDQLTIGEGED
jgi:hypothetical protein